MNSLYNATYNPDVLSCIANLSNDEVFTPPSVANAMIDLLPQELFSNPDSKFLDPACKSGVFLREIAKRLIKGLEKKIPDLQKRLDHIFKKQPYGIAITELTSLLSRRSLYCSKYPNCRYSVTQFDNAQGNIFFNSTKTQHRWVDGKCSFCGASREEYGDDKRKGLEKHAYQFIHNAIPGEIKKMKFDVIIGNPPYQLSDGGNGASAKPIYNFFVEQAKKLQPHYLVMITPSRWFAGGKGLDEYRQKMLGDKHIKVLVDYANAKDCFPNNSIGGGVSYFLWDKTWSDKCKVINIDGNRRNEITRSLDEYPVFIRYNAAINIVKKVLKHKEDSFSCIVSHRNPFGLSSKERGHLTKQNNDYSLITSQGTFYINPKEIVQGHKLVSLYKVVLSKVTAEHAGEPDKEGRFKVLSRSEIIAPDVVCTDSYLIIGGFNTAKIAKNLFSYMKTAFFRFLLLQSVSSINLSKEKFRFVPMQDFSKSWTDEELYKKYKLSKEEIDFIESMIRPME